MKMWFLKFLYSIIEGYVLRYQLRRTAVEAHVSKVCTDIDTSVADEETLQKLWTACKNGLQPTEKSILTMLCVHLPKPADALAVTAGEQVYKSVNSQLRHQLPPGLYTALMNGDVADFITKTLISEQERLKALLLAVLRDAMGIS